MNLLIEDVDFDKDPNSPKDDQRSAPVFEQIIVAKKDD